MVINHGMMPPNQKGNQQEVPQVMVANVMSPEDEEELFNSQMNELSSQAANVVLPKSEDLVVEESHSVKQQLDRKNLLDKLILFKKPKIKEFEISGVKFRLKRLNSDESYRIYQELLKIPQEEQLSKLDIMTLAGALVDMEGLLIEDLYSGPMSIKDPLVKRYLELCTWDSSLTRALNKVYSEFVSEAEKEYTPNFLEKK